MNREDLYQSFSAVDDDILERSENAAEGGRKPVWRKWGMLAACLCLAVGIAIPALRYRGGLGDKDLVLLPSTLVYNGKLYEAVSDPKTLQKFGLPSEITADMAGERVSYLQSDGGEYECTPVKTNIALYRYVPADCDGVYVLRDGEDWYAALFCNFYFTDSNMNAELSELYRIYGIDGAEDILSISEVDWRQEKTVGAPVEEGRELREFYTVTANRASYGNDDFQELMFGGYADEEDRQSAYTAFAEDLRILRVEAASGLCFFLDLHPSFDWLYGGASLSYYRMDDQLHDWISRNLGR